MKNPSSTTTTTKNSDGKLSNFFNCLDDIVSFQPLNINQLSSIVHLQLSSLEERMKEKEITVSLTDKAIQSILKASYTFISFIIKRKY